MRLFRHNLVTPPQLTNSFHPQFRGNDYSSLQAPVVFDIKTIRQLHYDTTFDVGTIASFNLSGQYASDSEGNESDEQFIARRERQVLFILSLTKKCNVICLQQADYPERQLRRLIRRLPENWQLINSSDVVTKHPLHTTKTKPLMTLVNIDRFHIIGKRAVLARYTPEQEGQHRKTITNHGLEVILYDRYTGFQWGCINVELSDNTNILPAILALTHQQKNVNRPCVVITDNQGRNEKYFIHGSVFSPSKDTLVRVDIKPHTESAIPPTRMKSFMLPSQEDPNKWTTYPIAPVEYYLSDLDQRLGKTKVISFTGEYLKAMEMLACELTNPHTTYLYHNILEFLTDKTHQEKYPHVTGLCAALGHLTLDLAEFEKNLSTYLGCSAKLEYTSDNKVRVTIHGATSKWYEEHFISELLDKRLNIKKPAGLKPASVKIEKDIPFVALDCVQLTKLTVYIRKQLVLMSEMPNEDLVDYEVGNTELPQPSIHDLTHIVPFFVHKPTWEMLPHLQCPAKHKTDNRFTYKHLERFLWYSEKHENNFWYHMMRITTHYAGYLSCFSKNNGLKLRRKSRKAIRETLTESPELLSVFVYDTRISRTVKCKTLTFLNRKNITLTLHSRIEEAIRTLETNDDLCVSQHKHETTSLSTLLHAVKNHASFHLKINCVLNGNKQFLEQHLDINDLVNAIIYVRNISLEHVPNWEDAVAVRPCKFLWPNTSPSIFREIRKFSSEENNDVSRETYRFLLQSLLCRLVAEVSNKPNRTQQLYPLSELAPLFKHACLEDKLQSQLYDDIIDAYYGFKSETLVNNL